MFWARSFVRTEEKEKKCTPQKLATEVVVVVVDGQLSDKTYPGTGGFIPVTKTGTPNSRASS